MNLDNLDNLDKSTENNIEKDIQEDIEDIEEYVVRTEIFEDKPKDKDKNEKKPKSKLRENIEAIIIAVVLALFIRTFIVQAFKIPSGSMKETLQIGDHILVSKFNYGIKIPFIDKPIIFFSPPKRDDIIVFKYPEDPSKDFIKRVIGVSGDVIEIRNKALYVNNKLVERNYTVFYDSRILPKDYQPRDNLGPITVPEKSLFVMGDNRDNSNDSRFWGYVSLDAVEGRAFMIYWSWDNDNTDIRWNRVFSLLK